MRNFSLRNNKYFPTFSGLPPDPGVELDLRYYEDPFETGGIVGLMKHWCLLVEIVAVIPYLRPMWTVQDKSGHKFPLVFYLDTGTELPKSFSKYAKPGNTISIMYAEEHSFVDGQCGLRVEELSSVKAYPCNLQTFLGLGDKGRIVASNKCQSCNSDRSPKTCSACHIAKYCNEECQRNHWLEEHKRECRALAQIKDWKGRNWGAFTDSWEYIQD